MLHVAVLRLVSLRDAVMRTRLFVARMSRVAEQVFLSLVSGDVSPLGHNNIATGTARPTMFSWSNSTRQRRPSSTSTSTSTYPAQRVATTVQGSIRPPEYGHTYTRSQHIDSYLNDETLKRSTRKVSADDSTYDTVFQTTAGDALILRVHLDATAGAPAMTLVGVRATHPWLDTRMRVVGYPHIQSDQDWQSSRMLLGAAVHEVVKHFQLQPPQLLEISDPGLRRLQANLVGGRVSSNAQDVSRDAPPDYESLFQVPEMPKVPTHFDEFLGTMSRQDMQQLLDDDLDFLTFFTTLPAHHEIQKLGNSVIVENVVLAHANLEKEAQLNELHDEVTSLQSSLKTKLETFEALEQEQNKLCAPHDTKQVLQKLSMAKKQAMDESEAYADEWVDEGGDVKEFGRVFVEKRKLHHVRAAKMERLKFSK